MAPMIMRFGTEKNKAEFLPGIARGEWLLVRTDQEVPKHRGLSIIMVPIDLPGIDVRPLISWRDHRVNQTFFDDVRVPRDNLIGEVNQGWMYVTGALDLERGAIATADDLRRELEQLITFCTTQTLDGVRLAERPEVRARLVELAADAEVGRLMCLAGASKLEDGEIPSTLLNAEKVFLSDLRQRIADYGTETEGPYGQLHWQDPLSPLEGSMERLHRATPPGRFGGGTNDVLRDIIAQRGYGMPSYGRGRLRPPAPP